MALFFTTKHAWTGLALDGVCWGAVMGAIVTLPYAFILGFGPLVGAVAGGPVGLVAGAVLDLARRRRCSAWTLAPTAVLAGLLVVYVGGAAAFGSWTAFRSADSYTRPSPVDGVGVVFAALAAVPLALDVRRQVQRQGREPGAEQQAGSRS